MWVAIADVGARVLRWCDSEKDPEGGGTHGRRDTGLLIVDHRWPSFQVRGL